MEYNFSLFFGLAVQAYEATLVSDETPFDRFLKEPDDAPLSPAAERGRKIFFNVNPNSRPRGARLRLLPLRLAPQRGLGRGIAANRPPAGWSAPRADSRATAGRATSASGRRPRTSATAASTRSATALSVAVRDAPAGAVVAADGTFKIPSLRNVALTAPYFHTGGEATLHDVVNFYARGGNRGGATSRPDRRRATARSSWGSTSLNFNGPTRFDAEAAKADLVAFLQALTDERVRIAAAPFDHPQIFVPNGHPGDQASVTQLNGRAVDSFLEIPATGPERRPRPARLPRGGLMGGRSTAPL